MSGEHSCNRFHTIGHSCVRVSLIIILIIKHEFLCIVSEQGSLMLIQLNFPPRIVTLTGHLRCTLSRTWLMVKYLESKIGECFWRFIHLGFLVPSLYLFVVGENLSIPPPSLPLRGRVIHLLLYHWSKNFSFNDDE